MDSTQAGCAASEIVINKRRSTWFASHSSSALKAVQVVSRLVPTEPLRRLLLLHSEILVPAHAAHALVGGVRADLVLAEVLVKFAAAGGVEGAAAAVDFLVGRRALRDGAPVEARERRVLLQQRGGQEVVQVHVDVRLRHHGLRRDEAGGDLRLLLLFHPGFAPLGGFFIQQGLDADATGF